MNQRRSTRGLAVLLSTALALSGCTQGLPGLRPLTYATPGEARIYASTEPCVHDPKGKEFIGIIAAVATAAVSTLLDNFGTALKNGAEGGNFPTVTAVRNMTLEPGRVPRCITLVRGSFDGAADGKPVDMFALLRVANGGETKTRLDSLKIPAMSRVDEFIELRLVEGPGRKALTYLPVFTLINQSLDGANKGRRDITINLKFSRPGASDAGGPVLLANREIGEGYPLNTDEDTGRADYEAPWFAFPNGLTPADPAGADAATKAKADAPSGKTPAPAPPPPPAKAGGITGGAGVGGGTQMAKPADSQIVDPYSQSQTAIPLTVTVTVVETRQTNEGLAFIAAVFTATKPAINSTIAPLLNLDAASTQDQTTFTAQADYAAAYGTAKTALIAYCESASPDATVAGRSDRWTKSSTARSAQLKANAAALKAALDAPFAAIVDISDAVPTRTTKGCGANP